MCLSWPSPAPAYLCCTPPPLPGRHSCSGQQDNCQYHSLRANIFSAGICVEVVLYPKECGQYYRPHVQHLLLWKQFLASIVQGKKMASSQQRREGLCTSLIPRPYRSKSVHIEGYGNQTSYICTNIQDMQLPQLPLCVHSQCAQDNFQPNYLPPCRGKLNRSA